MALRTAVGFVLNLVGSGSDTVGTPIHVVGERLGAMCQRPQELCL